MAPDITPELLDEIEAKARAATPGPWYLSGPPWFTQCSGVLAGSPDPHVGYMVADCETWDGEREEYRENGGRVEIAESDDDAAHIVCMHPPTTIALVTAYRNALARIVDLEARAERAERDRDALVEAIEPFAKEESTWACGISDKFYPGIVEPNQRIAHAKAEFSIGDLRRAARVLEQVRGKA